MASMVYEPRDYVEFERLQVDQVAPYDIAILADEKMPRWRILRLLGHRDAFGNLRYACLSEDGNEAEVYSITVFVRIERPDITPIRRV